jgi:Neuraminidase (sialidase)
VGKERDGDYWMNVEKMESVNDHQIRFNLNEMSVIQRDELERPLLTQQQESGQVDNDDDGQTILDIDQRQSSVYRKNALSGLSALTVQVC